MHEMLSGLLAGSRGENEARAMRTLPVPQPSFLAQPCNLTPLLVTEIGAARLLSVGRCEIKELIADRRLKCVDVNGAPRVTTESIASYVKELVAAAT